MTTQPARSASEEVSPPGGPFKAGCLADLPTGLRIMLTAFLAVIGCGYLVAVANIYERHRLADGKPDLSLDDIRAVYKGITVEASAKSETPSRMLTMIRSEMRQYFTSDADFTVLESWLKSGSAQAGLNEGEGKKTPRKVIVRDCLRCHGQSTGTEISNESPFGPDEFDVDFALISKYVAAPTQSEPAAAGSQNPESPLGQRQSHPQYTLSRLILVSHQHMLTIPVFTLIIGILFSLTRLPTRLRTVLVPIPMLTLLLDFGGWWLARASDMGVYFIAVAGGAFGLVFGLQIIVVAVELWRPDRRLEA